MIASSLTLAAAALFSSTSHAFTAITYPASIAAGSDFQFSATTGNDSSYTAYRVYLSTTPQGYSGGPSCYLQNSTSLSDTTLTLSIPTDFAPNGQYYSIITSEFPSQGSEDYTYGPKFTLSGSSISNFTSYETSLNGAPLWPADDLPCTAYNCARGCGQASFPGDLTEGSAGYTTMSSCVANCSGVADKSSTNQNTLTITDLGSSATSTSFTADDIPMPTTATTDPITPTATSTGAAVTMHWQAPLLAAGGALALMV